MFTFLTKYLAYRRLRPIVGPLPQRLAKAFGGGEHYTVAQVRRAIADVKLRKDAEPYAYAAACSQQELERGSTGLSAEEYRRLRAELADVFGLRPGFTVKDLLTKSFSRHQPAPENVYAQSGPPHH